MKYMETEDELCLAIRVIYALRKFKLISDATLNEVKLTPYRVRYKHNDLPRHKSEMIK